MAIKKKGLGRGLGALGLESPKEIFESQSSQKDHGRGGCHADVDRRMRIVFQR